MADNKRYELGTQGQGQRMTRSPSFSDWNGAASCAWKDAERSFSMLKNMTEKPRVKIEPPSVEPPCSMHPVVNCVVRKGPRTPRQDPRKFPKQRASTPTRRPNREQNNMPTNSYPESCLGMKRKKSDADLQCLPTSQFPTINTLIVKTMDRHFCELCQISCSSDLTFKQHLLGAAHKVKLEYEERNYSCNLCKIVCTDEGNLRKHLIGKKHMANKKKMENGVQIPIQCELCLVNCMNKDLFEAHLAGKPHAARVKELAGRRM